MALAISSLSGTEIKPHIEALGALRITVFREYPYLYDGSLDYEKEYLSMYLRSPQSRVILIFDDQTLVGATTCLPLSDAEPEFQKPFIEADIPLDTVCYFGESIILPSHRGRGIGKTFFQHREAHALTLPRVRMTAFCAVDRPSDHAARPIDYRTPETLWARCGYQRRPELQARFIWKELDETNPSEKTLTFWTRDVSSPT